MSNKNVYCVAFKPINNSHMDFNKKGDIGEVSIEVKAYSISEAMTIANGAVMFSGSDPHEISHVKLMFRPYIECDEDGD